MIMPEMIPFIPDNAPFTLEQRAWLNGYLAGLFASSTQPAAPERKPSLRIAILYASQSGTAEGLARKLAKELKAQGHQPALSTLVGYSPAALAGEKYALILASTYGDGEAPDGVQPFYEELCLEHFPRYEEIVSIRSSLWAIATMKTSANSAGISITNSLRWAPIALSNRVDCDVDVDEPLVQWKTEILFRLSETAAAHTPAKSMFRPRQWRKSPHRPPRLHARIRSLRRWSRRKTSRIKNPARQLCILAFSIEGTGITYEAGDACGVLPQNDINLVADILQALRFNGNEQVQCGKTEADYSPQCVDPSSADHPPEPQDGGGLCQSGQMRSLADIA